MKIRFFLLIVICSLSTGCATMFTEKTQEISFKTKPSGAEVALGTKTCITPCTLNVDKGKWQLQVMANKNGCNSQTLFLIPQIEPWTFANMLNFGFGFLVDIVTGTYVKYEPEYYIPLSGDRCNDNYKTASKNNSSSTVSREPKKQEEVVPTPSAQKNDEAKVTPSTKNTSMVIVANNAKIRKKPSTKAAIVKNLKKGEEVQVIKQDDEWFQVELASGDVGWCHMSVLTQAKR